MRVHRNRAAALASALLGAAALLAAPASAGEAYSSPEPTVSRYVPLAGGGAELSRAYEWGCADGESGSSGVRILFLGTQEEGGLLRPPGTTASSAASRVPAERTVEVAQRWAEGFAYCRTGEAEAVLALGVNNKDDGGVGGAEAGQAWARIVEAAHGAVEVPGVEVAGAVDAEPGWSPPEFARKWVEHFTGSSERVLYAANSADGCPSDRSGATGCNNGWSVADVHYVASGAADTLRAMPQIYRTDGIQARQWSHISAWGVDNGEGPVRFDGALSQRKACQQRSCDATDNSPRTAWRQLWDELNAHPASRVEALPHATDMRWP